MSDSRYGSNEDLALTILAVSLALLAVYNYATDVYGGAIVSGIGAILVVLFMLSLS